MTCPCNPICWRLAYSKYLLDHQGYPDGKPPKRLVLLCDGYATQDMMPKKGVFAENFPTIDAEGARNICPEIVTGGYKDCPEFIKWQKKQDFLKKRGQRSNSLRRPRVNIDRETRRYICRKYKYTCVYCGLAHNQLNEKGQKTRITIDHFIPLNKGGHESDLSNLVVACARCNYQKKDEIWELGCKIVQRG